VSAERVAVLVLAYGGPASLDEVGPFLARVMAPRVPSPEAVARAAERYRAIGGGSPLVRGTLAFARRFQDRLEQAVRERAAAPGQSAPIHVVAGMRHTEPSIAGAVNEAFLHADRVVAVVMASHQSERATGGYSRDVRAAYEALPLSLTDGRAAPTFVHSWHRAPAYVGAVADAARVALVRLSSRVTPPETHVLFTAHSVPLGGVGGDPEYEGSLRETAEDVARLLGIDTWSLAYQSRSPGGSHDWLGPASEDVLRQAASDGVKGVVVVPLGFVSEHLETLYDLDIELARTADDLGLETERAATVQESEGFMSTLVDAVFTRLWIDSSIEKKEPGN